MILVESTIFVLLTSIALVIYDWKIFISIFLILAIVYTLLSRNAKDTLNKLSLKHQRLNNLSLERLDTDLNSIEYIYLGNSRNYFQKLC